MHKVIIFVTLLTLSALGFACGGGTNTNVSNTANGNTANANDDNPLAVKTPTPAAVTNNAPTLTPVIKAYCDAMNKKDEAALRKIYSSDTLKNFETQMKQQKITSLMKFLEDDKVGNTCELMNEQINGTTASAVFKTDTYKTGLPIMFVQENGEWKLTNRSPAIDNMKSSNPNPPAANSNVSAK